MALQKYVSGNLTRDQLDGVLARARDRGAVWNAGALAAGGYVGVDHVVLPPLDALLPPRTEGGQLVPPVVSHTLTFRSDGAVDFTRLADAAAAVQEAVPLDARHGYPVSPGSEIVVPVAPVSVIVTGRVRFRTDDTEPELTVFLKLSPVSPSLSVVFDYRALEAIPLAEQATLLNSALDAVGAGQSIRVERDGDGLRVCGDGPAAAPASALPRRAGPPQTAADCEAGVYYYGEWTDTERGGRLRGVSVSECGGGARFVRGAVGAAGRLAAPPRAVREVVVEALPRHYEPVRVALNGVGVERWRVGASGCRGYTPADLDRLLAEAAAFSVPLYWLPGPPLAGYTHVDALGNELESEFEEDCSIEVVVQAGPGELSVALVIDPTCDLGGDAALDLVYEIGGELPLKRSDY